VRAESDVFFRRLLEAAGPSGYEREPVRVWREYAEAFATVRGDRLGSGFAEVAGDGGPHVIAMGHIDEIGLVVTHVDDDGFLWFSNVGGWDGNVLVGQRVRILTAGGPVAGVVGKKAIHLMDQEEREKAPKLRDLWIDIGAADADEARGRVRVGDMAVLEQPVVDLAERRVATRAADDRCGAFVAVEAARLYAESPGRARFTAVASVSEETAFTGAYTAGYALEPDAAIVIDVTNASDYPTTSKNQVGDVRLGRGPSISRGSAVHAELTQLVVEAAEAEGIPYQIEPAGGNSATDADAVRITRAGVPCAVVSVPLRYMHSPNELLDTGDLETCARLVCAVARRLETAPSAP
jgi:putative aminopeptidase FrvX